MTKMNDLLNRIQERALKDEIERAEREQALERLTETVIDNTSELAIVVAKLNIITRQICAAVDPFFAAMDSDEEMSVEKMTEIHRAISHTVGRLLPALNGIHRVVSNEEAERQIEAECREDECLCECPEKPADLMTLLGLRVACLRVA